MGFGFHPEAAGGNEDDEQDGADGEDLADAYVLGELAAEDEAGDLGGEDDRHDGGADAAHEGVRGLLLDEGLGRDDDAGYGEADDEIAKDGGPDLGDSGEQGEAEGDTAEAGVNEDGIADALAEGVERVDAEEHADADHGLGNAEDAGAGVERVADVDGDERAEASEDEHSGSQGEDDEEQGRVMDDEAYSLTHVGEDAGEASVLGSILCDVDGFGFGRVEGY